MSNVYSIDVRFYATAYIRADSEAQALEIAKGLKDESLEVEASGNSDIEVSGADFDSPELPDVSISPAMTCHGPDADAVIEDVSE